MTPASASSQWECSFLSVKVNGVWTSETRVENYSISRSTSLSKKINITQTIIKTLAFRHVKLSI
jgi:hypothetical protein